MYITYRRKPHEQSTSYPSWHFLESNLIGAFWPPNPFSSKQLRMASTRGWSCARSLAPTSSFLGGDIYFYVETSGLCVGVCGGGVADEDSKLVCDFFLPFFFYHQRTLLGTMKAYGLWKTLADPLPSL